MTVGGWPAESRSSGVWPVGSRMMLPAGTVPQMPQLVSVAFGGEGVLSVALVAGDAVEAAFDGVGVLSLDVFDIDSRVAGFDGIGALSVEVIQQYAVDVAFDGVGALSAMVYDGDSVQPVDVGFDGAGTLDITAIPQYAVDVAFDGEGALSATVAEQYAVDVAFDGVGDLGLQTVEVEAVAVGYGSTGTLTLDVVEVHQVDVAFSGSGDLALDVQHGLPEYVDAISDGGSFPSNYTKTIQSGRNGAVVVAVHVNNDSITASVSVGGVAATLIDSTTRWWVFAVTGLPEGAASVVVSWSVPGGNFSGNFAAMSFSDVTAISTPQITTSATVTLTGTGRLAAGLWAATGNRTATQGDVLRVKSPQINDNVIIHGTTSTDAVMGLTSPQRGACFWLT